MKEPDTRKLEREDRELRNQIEDERERERCREDREYAERERQRHCVKIKNGEVQR